MRDAAECRKVFDEGNGHTTILLGFEDATERRRTECAVQMLLEQKEMLLSEMSHRVASPLQIIASILLTKARTVGRRRPGRILSMPIDASCRSPSCSTRGSLGQGGAHAVGPDCRSGAKPCGLDDREPPPDPLTVVASDGTTSSGEAASLGLIVTDW